MAISYAPLRRTRTGRPTHEQNPPMVEHETQHEGDVQLGDELVWIEGSVLIHQEDADAQLLREPLDRLLARINQTRLNFDTNAYMTGDGLIYCSQRVPRTATGNRPRRYTHRQGFDSRLSLGTLEQMIAGLPGRTLQELTIDLYPNGTGTPQSREPTLRAALRRLSVQDRLRIERDPATGKKRYFTKNVQAYVGPEDQRSQLLGSIIAAHLGGTPDDHGSLIAALVETIEHNRGLPHTDFWRDPRGTVKTAYEQLPLWEEALPENEEAARVRRMRELETARIDAALAAIDPETPPF